MAKKVFKVYEDVNLTAEAVVIARYTDKSTNTQYIWKRVCGLYPEDSNINKYANDGLTLAYQRMIREAGKQAEGLKVVSTSGGEKVDTSTIKEV